MPREIYSLTDATHDTLADKVKQIADAWNKSQRHVYKILGEESNDPFAMFLSMYRAAAKSGITTSHWDAELEFTRQRFLANLPAKEIGACFVAQLHKQNRLVERYMEATQDGEWTIAEIDEIEDLLLAEMDAIRLSLRGLKLKKEKVEQVGSGPRLVS